MQLKIIKSIRRRIITLELSTIGFTPSENKMLDELGEPVVSFEKVYGTNAVQISKRIRTGFKIRLKFDGTEDIESTSIACSEFIEAIKAHLADMMISLQEDYEDLNDIKAEVTIEPISSIDYKLETSETPSIRLSAASRY
jgi:hypothetical protein